MNRTFETNGIELYYRDLGAGRPIVLLHGFAGSGDILESLFEDFQKEFRLIIPDMRGHGKSTNPSNLFSFKQVAEDVKSLLAHLNIEACDAVGFSGGGCSLLQLAFRNPGLLTSMVLVSAVPYFPDDVLKMMHESSTMKFEDDDMNLTPDMLSLIETRTLLIQGDYDLFYPIDMTIDMYKELPNAALWIVPYAGHVPINEDTMDIFIQTVRDFLG